MISERERAASALEYLDSGCDRSTWVTIIMAAKDGGLSFDDIVAWSEGAPNYEGEEDCQRVWDSIDDIWSSKLGPRVTVGTLYKMARDEGWSLSSRDGKLSLPALPPRVHPKELPVATGPSDRALEVWSQCQAISLAHPYIERKQGNPAKLRVYPHNGNLTIQGTPVAGYLVVPCYSPDGSLLTLQFIPGEGKKLNLPGASFGNGYFTVGNDTGLRRIFIVEGIGQAWAAWKVTGCVAVVSFGAGRMAKIADTLRAQHPDAQLTILPDRGKEIQAEAIARVIGGDWCELPQEMAQNEDVNDYMLQHGPSALAHLLGRPKEPAQPVPRFRLLGRDELYALPPLQWRIRSVLPDFGLAALYGPSASGKSFLGFDMAAAIAEGSEWFGYRVERAPVVYAALEGEAGFKLRAAAWETYRQRKLHEGFHMLLQSFTLHGAQDVQELAKVIPSGAVVFIDTLNRAAPTADENSSKDMGEILQTAKWLQTATGGLVVLVHHTGKDSSKGLRGHSSLFAALDAAIEVSRDGERREWRVAKSKDGQDGNLHKFKLEIKALGTDDYGDEISSCVVVADTSINQIRQAKLPTGPNQKLGMEALRPLFGFGDFDKPGAPPSTPCIALENAIEASAARLTCPTDKRTSRAREAITGLVSRGYLGCNDGWLWIV